jgi:hypothetical protein
MFDMMAGMDWTCQHGPAVDLWEQADENKLAELILYVAEKIRGDPTGGATKLNKVLYFAEVGHIRAHGLPITGAQYRKLPNGPAPRFLRQIRTRLIEEERAKLLPDDYFGRTMDRLIPLVAARTEMFSDAEVESVEKVIKALWGKSAKWVSDLSHEEPGWQLVDDDEDIPLCTAYLPKDPHRLTPAGEERRRQLAVEWGVSR